jgi:hypothetical protein
MASDPFASAKEEVAAGMLGNAAKAAATVRILCFLVDIWPLRLSRLGATMNKMECVKRLVFSCQFSAFMSHDPW